MMLTVSYDIELVHLGRFHARRIEIELLSIAWAPLLTFACRGRSCARFACALAAAGRAFGLVSVEP